MTNAIDLPPKYKEYAYEQFGETREIVIEKLEELRSRLLEVPSSPLNDAADLSDKNLIRFIRARKLHVDNTISTVVNWGKFKLEHPEWFEGLSSKEFGKKKKSRKLPS
jgi:cystathionine beta-lyase/cystathionine gamma-synthase